ncbi:HpcH/HpaI aldolase/citrate lyase family protein [Sporosarcina beigongshangi]|uniref:HpcH/HpaI aldolase/citrate lyase family protein n=1 Tax=Sporosarcina beigongshangi TaxID=2782538 RepID=UPI0019399B54|nr:HpcH/HpaI aldolase/citrate lyase family protein [Sporosarcina beigongshangi]
MKHFDYETLERRQEIFFQEPEHFTKFTEKEILSYALGATLYMPALKKSIAQDLIDKKISGLTSMVIDLEDAVGDNQLRDAEHNLFVQIQALSNALDKQLITIDDLPLIFVRLRNPKQMQRITTQLGNYQRVLTGYVFPKFSYETGKEYLAILEANNRDGMLLYGMPILESSDIIYKETRIATLLKLKELIDTYRAYILNIRIGATDFCGLFGIRRNVDTTIYDVALIRDCITDILNLFNRQENGYIVSGPVWEYFSKDQRILKSKLRMTPFQDRYGRTGMQKRTEIINHYIDGLINEVLLDRLNGIVGKTVIHPTHIKTVHSLYTVSHEEYSDALSIIANSEGQAGVLKSQYNNKMNEMKPHLYWAKRILLQARIFGVYNEDQDFTSLIMDTQHEEEFYEVKV